MSKKFRIRLYLETTVFNYYFDERKGHEDVVKLFEAIRAGKLMGYTSRYVTDEIKRAQEPKRTKMLSLIKDYGIIMLEPSSKAEDLASEYIDYGIIPKSHFYDSVHIATASINGIEVIVSYNFHHINREKTRMQTFIVNKARGYYPVDICTAEEVLKYAANSGSD